jgi:hypothetical protein
MEVWIKANFVVGRMPKLTNGPVLQLGELLSPKQYPCEVVFMLTVYNRITLQVDLQADKSPVVVKGPSSLEW